LPFALQPLSRSRHVTVYFVIVSILFNCTDGPTQQDTQLPQRQHAWAVITSIKVIQGNQFQHKAYTQHATIL